MKKFLLILLLSSQVTYGANCPMFMSGPMNGMMGMVNMMSGMMGSMPFIGGMARGMKQQMMEQMYQQVLNSPQMTKDMVQCAKQSNQMVEMMLQTLSKSPQLLERMSQLMTYDPEFTKLFLELSLTNYQVNQFFYRFINPSLYRSLTMAMSKSDAVTWYVSESLRRNNKQVLNQQSALVHIMMLLGQTDNNSDGLEKSLERFLYATVSNPYATENFVNTINFIDENVKEMLLNFIFLGQGVQQHTDQAALNIYAMIKAMDKSLVPNYDLDEQLSAEAENRANRVMAKLLGLLMPENKPTQLAGNFFQVLLDATFIHQMPEAQELMELMQKILPTEMFQNMPQPNPESPAPRDFLTQL